MKTTIIGLALILLACLTARADVPESAPPQPQVLTCQQKCANLCNGLCHGNPGCYTSCYPQCVSQMCS